MYIPNTAMILAAGLGLRMRPITDSIPKPLVKVLGRTLIDRAVDRLVEAGVTKITVNTHYRHEMIEAHLAKRKDVEIAISHEKERLETGGGVKNALQLIGDSPFFVISSDVIWLNGPENALHRLASAFLPGSATLLLHPTYKAYGYSGPGDFTLDQLFKLTMRKEKEIAPLVFTGAQILDPALFRLPEVVSFGDGFPLSKIYRLLNQTPSLRGIRHDGAWLHIGDPAGLALAEKLLGGERL